MCGGRRWSSVPLDSWADGWGREVCLGGAGEPAAKSAPGLGIAPRNVMPARAITAMATAAAARGTVRRTEARILGVDTRRRATESGARVNLAASGRWAAAVALQDELASGAARPFP